MSEYRWVIAHFSPTGTTLKVARAVAKGAGCPVREVDLLTLPQSETVEENEVLLVAMPVYHARVPAVALKNLAALKGSGQPAVAVVVYGNRAYDNALMELKDSLEENGFRVAGAAAFVGEHSISRSIAAGRPDDRDRELAAGLAVGVMKKLAAGDLSPVQVPGDQSYRGSDIPASPNRPSAPEGCVGCGTCVRSCPLGVISTEAPAEAGGEECICCLHCVAVCPKQVRRLPDAMVEKVQAWLTQIASEPKQPELFL